MQQRLLKMHEVIQVLGISRAKGYEFYNNGAFDDFKVEVGPRSIRFRPDGFTEYIKRGGRKASDLAEAYEVGNAS